MKGLRRDEVRSRVKYKTVPSPNIEIKTLTKERRKLMNVQIQSVKFDADKKLIDFVKNKIKKLEKFAEDAISLSVIMKLDKDSDKGNKVVTMKMDMPGGDVVAEFRNRTFEESVDEGVEAIKKQLEKRKEARK